MPLIQVSMATGRSPEQIRELIHQLTEVAVNVAKAPPEAITVVVTEVEHDKWATADVTIAEKRAQASS
jgi:4-oxalocrotonate tautomerase